MHLLRVISADSGDDAIAFNVAGDPTNRPIYGITMDLCEAYTRKNPQYGAALKFGGASEALVTNSTFTHAKNALVTLLSYPGGFHPTDIQINDCKLIGGKEHSFEVKANKARRISARRNYMHRPGQHCVRVVSLDGAPHTFDVTVTDNTLSKPGSTQHVYKQKNLSGVYTKGNHLVYEYTTPPTLALLTPDPGSTVKGPVERIEVRAKASVSRNENDLRKGNIKLFINGRRMYDFDYYAYLGKVVVRKPRLRSGKNTVRAELTLAGETTTKDWSFSVR